jgi:hypothetical protein
VEAEKEHQNYLSTSISCDIKKLVMSQDSSHLNKILQEEPPKKALKHQSSSGTQNLLDSLTSQEYQAMVNAATLCDQPERMPTS